MDKTREVRRSSTTMATVDEISKRRRRISENIRGQMHHEMGVVRDLPEKKHRGSESLNRYKRKRSERFAPRNETYVQEHSSDESQGNDDAQHNCHKKSFLSGRIPRHVASLKVADEMIGVPVPRKARSACIKRSPDCRTSSGSGGGGFVEDRRRPPVSPGSYSFEVVSLSSSTVSVKHKKNVNGSKSRIPKPPKSSVTIEDDLEIEIAEVLSGLKKQSHSSKREDDSENSLKLSEVKGTKKLKTEGDDSSTGADIGGLIICKARIKTGHSTNVDKSINETKTTKSNSVVSDIQKEEELRQETPSILDGVLELDTAVSKGVSKGPPLLECNRDESNCSNKLEIDVMVPPTISSLPERVSLLPLVSDSIVTKGYSKQDSSVKSKEKIDVKSEMTSEEVKQQKVEKNKWLNLNLERLSQETGRDSSRRLQNLDWSQPQLAESAQQGSVLPFSVDVDGLPSGIPSQGCVPPIQNYSAVNASNGSSTLVQGSLFSASQPRPKRCTTHFFIARNIQLHQTFVKTNYLLTPNKGSVYLKGGELGPAAENPCLQASSPILSLNSQTQDRVAVNISAPKDKASESGNFASTIQKKPQPPSASSSIGPAQAIIFPTNYHLQPVMIPSKSHHPAKNPCVAVGSASVNFNHPSSSAREASSPYFTVLPDNAYSFQLSSTIRDGTSSQPLPFFNGSFYSPQMFQPSQLLQKQSQFQRETEVAGCSSSSHRQPQVSVNSLSSQANVQKHRQPSQKCEAKASRDNSDSRGSYAQKGGPNGQIMTAPMQPQNFSMSFASFAGGFAPANLSFSSNGYHIVAAPPIDQKNHQTSDSKMRGGKCSNNADDLKKTLTGKPPAMMNGQTLVFDSPSRTLNFVSGTWPPPAITTINGDPSVFTHHITQRQQSGRSKMTTHSQAESVPVTSSQWKTCTTSTLTSCNSLNLKQIQSQRQIITHGQTQISFAAPLKSQLSQGQQRRSGGSYSSSSSATGSGPNEKAGKHKANNNKDLLISPVSSAAANAQDQTENSGSGSTHKTSPVCAQISCLS